jgi:hypothetical protein
MLPAAMAAARGGCTRGLLQQFAMPTHIPALREEQSLVLASKTLNIPALLCK